MKNTSTQTSCILPHMSQTLAQGAVQTWIVGPSPSRPNHEFWQRKFAANEDEATVYLDSGGAKYTVSIFCCT